MRAGQLDMGLTNCRDPYDSPHTPAGTLCHVAPAMCMLCRNAVVFTAQLPRLLQLAGHIQRPARRPGPAPLAGRLGTPGRRAGRAVRRLPGRDRQSPRRSRGEPAAGPAARHANGVPPVTASSWPHVPPTPAFGDAELVFAGHPDKIPGVSGPVFGRSDEWPADAIRRPSNKSPGAWKLRFPVEPAWNLRAREASFALLNPGHQALREAGVHLPAQPAALQTLAQLCHHLAMVMRWARQHALPADLPAWTSTHWDAFLEEAAGRLGPSSVTGYVSSIRRLVVLAPVLTGGGPGEDPWPNRTAADVGRRTTRPGLDPGDPARNLVAAAPRRLDLHRRVRRRPPGPARPRRRCPAARAAPRAARPAPATTSSWPAGWPTPRTSCRCTPPPGGTCPPGRHAGPR